MGSQKRRARLSDSSLLDTWGISRRRRRRRGVSVEE